MIQSSSLTYQYPSSSSVLAFPNLHLDEAESLLILGKSGVGKTTLLHLLAGLIRPATGNVTINHTDITTLSAKALDAFRGKQIGMVFQNNHALRSLTVLENLKARLYFTKKTSNKNALVELLNVLGIADCQNKKTNELSIGQLQRLGIALAVVHQPKLILADEPTSSLDDTNCTKVMQLLQEQATANKANLIVITHDQRIKANFKNVLTL
ncbi:ABC transporter ATP-binding protein [Flavobacterium sp. ASW18X]|uniref:ABC transporter ATP-binding protein n=1 Tax=Flavobacterium sp. ASW18X TaxID=2572595 RepID=UPI0010ADAF46|nr:ATP-binding cassette domain-containing protein [Flavobacterium sp. ASW18X]TKD61419.1 ATP-binding cassette domain-containing protein [Flavobacterium sp. ASW18X]